MCVHFTHGKFGKLKINKMIKIELKHHKAKSKFISKFVSNNNESNIIQISLDMMQNQPLPKVPFF